LAPALQKRKRNFGGLRPHQRCPAFFVEAINGDNVTVKQRLHDFDVVACDGRMKRQ
jgi:hypothetical protein